MVLFLLRHHGLLVGLCMQDYKSLCVADTISATLVYFQIWIHRQHFDQLVSIVEPAAELK